MPDPITNAGYYGATATLPGDPGPPEPSPLPGALAWDSSVTGSAGAGAGLTGASGGMSVTDLLNLFTRMDPNMGYLAPSLNINPGEGYPAPGAGAQTERARGFLGRLFDKTPAGAIYNILSGNSNRIPIVKLFNALKEAGTEPWQSNATQGSLPPVSFTRGTPVGGSGGFQQMQPNEYAQATFGGVTPTGFRDPAGSAAFDSQAANRQLMNFQARAGTPNRNTPDVRNLFDPTKSAGHINDQGFIERTPGGIDPVAQEKWARWTFGDQVADHARIRAAQAERAANPFAFLLPPPAPAPFVISGPPRIPGI